MVLPRWECGQKSLEDRKLTCFDPHPFWHRDTSVTSKSHLSSLEMFLFLLFSPLSLNKTLWRNTKRPLRIQPSFWAFDHEYIWCCDEPNKVFLSHCSFHKVRKMNFHPGDPLYVCVKQFVKGYPRSLHLLIRVSDLFNLGMSYQEILTATDQESPFLLQKIEQSERFLYLLFYSLRTTNYPYISAPNLPG